MTDTSEMKETAETVKDKATSTMQKLEGRARVLAGRARHLAKEHPTLALAAAAGVGAVVGLEFAVGALVGIAATSVVTNRSGRELRDEIMRRGRDLLGKPQTNGETPAGAATEGPKA